MSKTPDLKGWLPVSISKHTAEPVVEWCRFGTRRFTESFFDHTVQNAMREPFNLLFRHQTSLDTLVDWQMKCPGMQPRAAAPRWLHKCAPHCQSISVCRSRRRWMPFCAATAAALLTRSASLGCERG